MHACEYSKISRMHCEMAMTRAADFRICFYLYILNGFSTCIQIQFLYLYICLLKSLVRIRVFVYIKQLSYVDSNSNPMYLSTSMLFETFV